MPVFGYYNTDLFESQYPFFKPSPFVFPKTVKKPALRRKNFSLSPCENDKNIV